MNDLVGKSVTGWLCFICGENANVMAYGNTWCFYHLKQSQDFLGIDKGKTHMQLRENIK